MNDTTRLSQRLILGLALVALAALLAGCGVTGSVDPVAAAATKSQNAGGAKLDFSVGLSGGGKSFGVTGTGAFDQNEGELTVDLSQVLQQAGAPAGIDSTAKAVFLEESGDEVVYLNLPFVRSQLLGGKSWVKLDLTKAGQSFGADLDQLMSQVGQSPGQLLDLLRQTGEVEEIGHETLDGTSTTHYKATVDLVKAAEDLGGASQQAVQRLIDQGAPAKLPVDVWVGDDGLVRQLTMSYAVTKNGEAFDLSASFKLSDYGTDVTVSAPSGDQVFDLTGIASALGSAMKPGGSSGP
jgi:hypothetical protein